MEKEIREIAASLSSYLLEECDHKTEEECTEQNTRAILSSLLSASELGRKATVKFIRDKVQDSGMSEGHDGEEPTGDWIYDLPERILNEAEYGRIN